MGALVPMGATLQVGNIVQDNALVTMLERE